MAATNTCGQFCRNALESSLVHLGVVWLASTFCFLPLWSGAANNLANTQLSMSLKNVHGGSYYQVGSVAILAAVLPLFIDVMLDLWQDPWTGGNGRKRTADIMTNTEKFTFHAGLVCLSILSFLDPHRYDKFELIYLCTQRAQIMLISGVVAVNMYSFDPQSLPLPLLWYILLGGGAFCAVGSHFSNTRVPEPQTPMYIGSNVVGYGAACALILAMVRWLWRFVRGKVSEDTEPFIKHKYVCPLWRS